MHIARKFFLVPVTPPVVWLPQTIHSFLLSLEEHYQRPAIRGLCETSLPTGQWGADGSGIGSAQGLSSVQGCWHR